ATPPLGSLPPEPLDLGHQPLDHFPAACDLIADARFTANNFKLLATESRDRTFFTGTLFVQVRERRLHPLNRFDHAETALFGVVQLSCPGGVLALIAAEFL